MQLCSLVGTIRMNFEKQLELKTLLSNLFHSLALRGSVFLYRNSQTAMLSKLGASSFQVKPFRLL